MIVSKKNRRIGAIGFLMAQEDILRITTYLISWAGLQVGRGWQL
jgi:hypothetical protein